MISYDPESHKFTGIEADWLERCRATYRNINLEQVMRELSLWLEADWPKRAKKKYKSFLTRNFARAENWRRLEKLRMQKPPELKRVRPRPVIEEEVSREEIVEFVKQLANKMEMK